MPDGTWNTKGTNGGRKEVRVQKRYCEVNIGRGDEKRKNMVRESGEGIERRGGKWR